VEWDVGAGTGPSATVAHVIVDILNTPATVSCQFQAIATFEQGPG
jgi:hypothetical protein